MKLRDLLSEAEYTHIGYGKYKEKGKEKDPNAQTFKKDDGGKFVPVSSEKPQGGDDSKKDTPKVNIFDKPKSDDLSKYKVGGGPLEKNPEIFVPSEFDKAIDKLKDSQLTIPNVAKLANKFGVETDDALKYVSFGRMVDLGVSGEPKSNISPKKVKDDLEDIKGTKSEKLMNSLLKGDKDPQTSLGLGDSQYDTLLKKLARIGGESEHEGKFRTNNYSTAELEKWAKERAELVSNQSKEEPKSEPKNIRKGNPDVNKKVRAKADSFGITPEKLGKEEYQTKMAQAAVEALTDSNFHSEARELIAKLEGKPEWAEKPDFSKAPKMGTPEYDEWQKNSVYSSKYYDADEQSGELGRTASQEAGWDGVDAADSIANTLRDKGFDELADTIQSVFDNKAYMKQEGNIRLSKL